MPRLKKAQYWILENILYKVKIHESAHGFVPERSIVSNAKHFIRNMIGLVSLQIDLIDNKQLVLQLKT